MESKLGSKRVVSSPGASVPLVRLFLDETNRSASMAGKTLPLPPEFSNWAEPDRRRDEIARTGTSLSGRFPASP